jgi:integrase
MLTSEATSRKNASPGMAATSCRMCQRGGPHRTNDVHTDQRRRTLDGLPDSNRLARDLVIWEPDETARFLEYARSDRLAALYEVAAFSGLRRAELCGLRWSDLTNEEAGAQIQQTVVELPGSQSCPTCGGHASPEITRKVYGHLMKSRAADQVEVASKLVTRGLADVNVRYPLDELVPVPA